MAFTKQQIEVIDLMAAGHDQCSAAKEVGICRSTIWKWFKKKEFSDRFEEEVRSRFKAVSGGAFNRMVELSISAKSEQVRLNANKELLDRSGMTIKQDININNHSDILVEFINPLEEEVIEPEEDTKPEENE